MNGCNRCVPRKALIDRLMEVIEQIATLNASEMTPRQVSIEMRAIASSALVEAQAYLDNEQRALKGGA